MDSRTPEEVMQFALAKYSEVPDYDKVTYYNNTMEKLITGQILFQTKGIYAISSDPLEDADDPIMLRHGCMNTKSDLVIIISNGFHTCEERFAHIKELFPCFQGAEFNLPFKTLHNTILFKEDGCELDMELDGYLNAGPIHSRTLASISRCLKKKSATRVITVGAKEDCTLGGGINQKQTDDIGKLITIPNVWNQFIADIKGVYCENLSVELSRHVLIPNPLYMKNTSYGEMHDSCIDQLVDNVGMFMASRPDPAMPVAARINEGNSIVDYKYLQMNQENYKNNKNYEAGLEKLGEYMELAKSKGVDKSVYESAAIPIMTTHMFGGRYKSGQFGWAPGDAKSKHEAACLLPETVPLFKENIKHLRYMSPAYDVIAFIKMMS
jgi:hypothetical protein